jgi:CAAX amino terminal protease family.
MSEIEIKYEPIPQVPIKKEIKHNANYISGGLLIYELIMFASMIGYMIYQMVVMVIKNPDSDIDKITKTLTKSIEQTGVPYLIAIIIGIPLLLLYFWSIHPNKIKALFVKKNKMKLTTFLMLIVVCMSGQALFSAIGSGVEWILNLFGLSILQSMEDASANSSTISMLLYTSLFAPITEELIFRGLLLRRLEKYGRLFAIITTAILFGAFHGNLIQGLFAAFIGMIFAYVALEYSIIWAILLHIINNFIFGELFNLLTKGLNNILQDIISNVMVVGFFLGAVIIIFYYRKRILEYIRSNRTEKGYYRYTFTSCVTIILLLIQLIMGIIQIQKI